MSGTIRTAAGGLVRCAPFITILFSSLLSLSCSSPHQAAVERPAAHSASPVEKMFVPAGWSIASDEGTSSSTEFHLAKNDGDAAMILRELKPTGSAKDMLTEEDICVLGNISMQSKLGTEDDERRILRLPSAAGEGKQCCVYVYSENSLLRRVAVFRTKSKIYELELRQNNESFQFSSAVDAQTLFVESMMKGR
ncbi:MAG: hypothetical protein WBZ48_13635 [Bacteroidota bacterium]